MTEEERRARRREISKRYRKKHPDKARASQAKYRASHKEQQRARVAAYKLANVDKIKAARKRWEEANRAKIAATGLSYRMARREATRARAKAKRIANREQMRANDRAYRLANPDQIRETKRAYRAANQAKERERRKLYNARNRAEIAAKHLAYARANPGIVNAISMKRWAAKLKSTPPWANMDDIRKIYEEAGRLTRDTGTRWEVDHIIPLQNVSVCGLHVSWNLQLLTKAENIRKHNKIPAHANNPAAIAFCCNAAEKLAATTPESVSVFGSSL